MKLELALMTLTESSNHCVVTFWGKVEGIKSDYYVACGLNYKGCYDFPVKSFYWCNGKDFNFAKLP